MQSVTLIDKQMSNTEQWKARKAGQGNWVSSRNTIPGYWKVVHKVLPFAIPEGFCQYPFLPTHWLSSNAARLLAEHKTLVRSKF
jgi:hypothetical protein